MDRSGGGRDRRDGHRVLFHFSAAATAAPTSPSAAATAGPVNTPDNTVPTVDPNASNTSFQTAKAIGKDPIKVTFKDSEFFYKLDIARGGILSLRAGAEQQNDETPQQQSHRLTLSLNWRAGRDSNP